MEKESNSITKNISKGFYGILGSLLILGGLTALISPNSAHATYTNLPSTGLKILGDLNHTFMELGAAVFALGALLIWGIFNFDKMKSLNYILLLFFVPFGGIHWLEWGLGNRSIGSPLINSIPAILMIIIILIRRNSK